MCILNAQVTTTESLTSLQLLSSLRIKANFWWARSSNLTWPGTAQSQSTQHRNRSCSGFASDPCTHLARVQQAVAKPGGYSVVPGQWRWWAALSGARLGCELRALIVHTMLQTRPQRSLTASTKGHTVTEMLTDPTRLGCHCRCHSWTAGLCNARLRRNATNFHSYKTGVCGFLTAFLS